MSLVTLIRDYVDVANSTQILDGHSVSSLAYHTLIFLFTVTKQALVYSLTLQWIRDFSYFCFTSPSIFSSFTNIGEIGRLVGVFTNDVDTFENQPFSHLLAFSDLNLSTGIGIVFLGLFNGCFSCMHLSAAHLVTIRRMLVQGVPAGLCSAFGTAIGQFFFLVCVLFGFRGILLPWLALEPLQFLAGTAIILSVASNMAQDKRTPTIQWSAKSSLFVYSCINAVLAWCEQAAIFQWVGNFSFGAEPTFLESTPSLKIEEYSLISFGAFQQLAQNLSYLLAFFIGSIIGASILAFLLQRFLELVLRSKRIAVYYGLIKQANLPLATLIFAFGFGSIPYYGLDYLFTKGFGFVPQENSFKQTLFSPINLVSKTSQSKDSPQSRLEDQLALFFTLEGEKSKSFAVDTTPFDDGQYLKTSQKRPQAFEDLNYRGEHLWTNRLSRISNIREQANQTQSSFLGPVFSWMRSFLWGDEPTNFLASHPEGKDQVTSLSQGDGANSESSTLGSFPNSMSKKENPPSEFFNDDVTGINNNTFFTRKKELSAEMEQHDNYLKEFDRYFDKGFSNFYDADSHSLIEVEDQWQEKRIKEKCYTNPIYKFLLNTEIDAFLRRQPKSHWLSPQEEILLLKRRQLLGNYYDTLALTNQVPTSTALEQLVPKSYANTIYNHQFKGTLKTARRLFSVKRDVNPSERAETSVQLENSKSSVNIPNIIEQEVKSKISNKSQIIKFDQPLFSKEKSNTQRILFHEELSGDHTYPANTFADSFDRLHWSPDVESKVNKKTSPLANSINSHQKTKSGVDPVNLPLHSDNKSKELLDTKDDFKENSLGETNVSLLEQADSTPLYAGWDEELRKFVITNRYENRSVAGYIFSQPPKRLSETNKMGKSTIFTTWPIPNPLIHNISSSFFEKKSSSSQPGNLAGYEIKEDVTKLGKKESENSLQSLQSLQPLVAQIAQKKDFKSLLTNDDKILKCNNNFLFQCKPVTNDMTNALLQWQKLIKENKQLSKEDKEVAKEKVSYWPNNVRRANWFNELVDNEIEFEEPTENVAKKKTILWEFTPPSHGGFIWSGGK